MVGWWHCFTSIIWCVISVIHQCISAHVCWSFSPMDQIKNHQGSHHFVPTKWLANGSLAQVRQVLCVPRNLRVLNLLHDLLPVTPISKPEIACAPRIESVLFNSPGKNTIQGPLIHALHAMLLQFIVAVSERALLRITTAVLTNKHNNTGSGAQYIYILLYIYNHIILYYFVLYCMAQSEGSSIKCGRKMRFWQGSNSPRSVPSWQCVDAEQN